MPITVLGEKDPNSLLKGIAKTENIELPTDNKTKNVKTQNIDKGI